jgi:hypothetical protein
MLFESNIVVYGGLSGVEDRSRHFQKMGAGPSSYNVIQAAILMYDILQCRVESHSCGTPLTECTVNGGSAERPPTACFLLGKLLAISMKGA